LVKEEVFLTTKKIYFLFCLYKVLSVSKSNASSEKVKHI